MVNSRILLVVFPIANKVALMNCKGKAGLFNKKHIYSKTDNA